jgi:hypothetical protein
MASQLIPTLTDGTQAYTVTVRLDGVSFRFDFAWNERGGFWAFILSDAAGEQLMRRKVVVGLPLTARFVDPRLPPGDFIALDTSGQDVEAGLQDLGDRVQLVYLEAADLAA